MKYFANRNEAGNILASRILKYSPPSPISVLALPRGGIPIALPIANALKVKLDIFIARKLGVPWHTEFAFGAIALPNILYLDKTTLESVQLNQEQIQHVIDKEKKELDRRTILYRGHRNYENLKDTTVILADDGIATGATMQAAIKGIKSFSPKSLWIAVPVADKIIIESLSSHADKIICINPVNHLNSVGMWYEEFSQLNDEEVLELLSQTHP